MDNNNNNNGNKILVEYYGTPRVDVTLMSSCLFI